MRADHRIPQVRCAIYTRKSTDEGLDRDFNTLDAQRDSAEHFIRAQAQEGWIVVPRTGRRWRAHGGKSGPPRPETTSCRYRKPRGRLCVVYKVDRLTRSLTDFSKMIETFEKNSVTFVSVTQHFNTTNPLGG